MIGTFALAGGDEFRQAYEEPDRALLAMLPASVGRIVIVPTAAAQQGPQMAIANGVRHFQRLAPRATVEGVMVIDAASANDPALAARVASASMIYLTGGDPGYLVRALRGSETLAAIAAVAARGGVVAGSSAGAMALGEVMRWGGGWEPGLHFVPGIVVLPHHPDRPQSLDGARAGLAERIVVLGIPTGVMCVSRAQHPVTGDPDAWEVLGRHPVTLYRADGISQAAPGETFTL
jgi:cyanophycinase-like exopeptidase